MAKYIFLSSVLIVAIAASSYAGVDDTAKDHIRQKQLIARKLCGPGNHPDKIAQQFFACYQEETTPRGSKLVDCQEEVYGFHMDSEEHVGKACVAKESFKTYVDCFTKSLHHVSDTLQKLNACQAGVVGLN